VEAAFNTMKQFDLYDIKASEKKYDASFELYLYAYQMPFVFVNSTGTNLDKLTLTHEFGHFCRDYLSYGAQQSLDVGEYFSQAMENLSLFYGTEGDAMRPLRLQQSLNVYVEQAAYASFEQQVYSLTGDDLTVENVDALFESTMASYGMDIWDIHKRDYVQIPHLFISPLYIISYIVSNDAALQIYQQEEKRAGAGLETYLQTLQTSQIRLMGFVEETGLESPFAPKRLETVRQTFEKALLSE
jgi:oligoendopeptidase F